MNATKTMPSRKEFWTAEAILKARGFEHTVSVMADDAKKEGVTNFGMVFLHADGREFYLNYKTIDSLPS